MEPETEDRNKYTVPIAVIVAGILIAGSVIYTNRDNTAERLSNENRPSAPSFSIPPVTPNDHVLGNPDAKIFVVEYSDTECPFCKDLHDSLHRVVETYGKTGEVAWVYRHFPIAELHSKAVKEAEATECAAELGGNSAFWQYIDRIFEITPSNNGLDERELPAIAEHIGLNRSDFEQCLLSRRHQETVKRQIAEAKEAGGRGTPFSIVVSEDAFNIDIHSVIASAATQLPPQTIVLSDDGKRIALNGALPFDFIKLILDIALGKEIELEGQIHSI